MEQVKIGSRVEVTRINQENRTGTVLERVEHLRHIGEYYYVGEPLAELSKGRGRPRKEAPKKIIGMVWGMYEAKQMRVLPEHGRKTGKTAAAAL